LTQEQTSLNAKGAKLKLYKEGEVEYNGKDYWATVPKLVHIHVATLCELLDIPPPLELSSALTLQQVPFQAVMAVQDMRTGQLDFTAQWYGGKHATEHWGNGDTVKGDFGQSSEAHEARWNADRARKELHYQTEQPAGSEPEPPAQLSPNAEQHWYCSEHWKCRHCQTETPRNEWNCSGCGRSSEKPAGFTQDEDWDRSKHNQYCKDAAELFMDIEAASNAASYAPDQNRATSSQRGTRRIQNRKLNRRIARREQTKATGYNTLEEANQRPSKEEQYI
jgi:hypothetical protein